MLKYYQGNILSILISTIERLDQFIKLCKKGHRLEHKDFYERITH